MPTFVSTNYWQRSKRCIALIGVCLLFLSLQACSKNIEESPEYQAACEGPVLQNVEQREKAQQDGYAINRQYDCIDKASFNEVAEQKAKWEAANTPQALAKNVAEKAAERAKLAAQEQAQQRIASETPTPAVPPSSFVLRAVDVNTASEAELAEVDGVGPALAAQIVRARKKGSFDDWADLGSRVPSLGASQSAALASVGGLNVDGQSLAGAAANPALSAKLNGRYANERR
jgi:DNA uptake protein ComE-like DNA-binding protein